MKKILMVCYGGGHVKIIEPLYQFLKDDYSITILALTLAAPYLDKLNIPYVTFKNFKSLFSSDVEKYGYNLMKNIPDNKSIELEDSIYYMGCSYFDLVSDMGKIEAEKLYENKGRGAFFPKETLNKIIRNINPDLVLTTNSPRAERAALFSAKEMKIPTLCINDNLWFTNGVLDVVKFNLANTVCVLSEKLKNELQKYNKEMNIAITGNPVFDELKEIKRTYNKDKITVLFADCDLPRVHPLYPDIIGDPLLADDIRTELNELAISENFNVIFRPHPNQDIDYSKYKNIVFSRKNESLKRQLMVSDVVLTNISTVGVEGLISGAALVSIEGTVFNKYHSYYEMGLSTPVYSAKELSEAFSIALNKKSSKMELYPGLAVDNIANEIQKLISK